MPREIKKATLTWQDGLRFVGGEPEGPIVTVDGDNQKGPGPMLTLLLAAAACTGSDVVAVLQKMRVSLSDLRIEVSGTRREEEPRRYVAIHLDYALRGKDVDPAKAR